MKRTTSALAVLAVLAAAPGFADDIPELTEDEWWKKEGFGFVQGYYTQYKIKDLGKPMQGGGFAIGGEYVNEDAHLGIGGALSFSWTMQDYTGYKANEFLFGFDLHVPLRVSNSLTVYVGGGGTMHGFDLDFDDEWGVFGGDKWHNDGASVTGDAFVGFRWRYLEHAYVFGEYRREFGKIDMVCENYEWTRDFSHPKDEYDMSGNRFLAGIGILF